MILKLFFLVVVIYQKSNEIKKSKRIKFFRWSNFVKLPAYCLLIDNSRLW